ncbi:SANT/Myb_domain [Hexamita inflata]|uniref:SANT/Myb domain n=1 Tax=Hexamita inflata TaxID=28002 RepID=A0AA86N580_9EUKA|nr:SANT/Myb domain [Hexamita inflata]CAI9913008.1 SANT/Myb domain [Hexamita inflata]CAI9923121.1 SANT/Myb domain [Hexamita inflata]
MESMTSSKKSYNRWNRKDQALFVELYKEHEIAFDKYLPSFPGRTESQIKSFYYNKVHQNKVAQKMRENASQVREPVLNAGAVFSLKVGRMSSQPTVKQSFDTRQNSFAQTSSHDSFQEEAPTNQLYSSVKSCNSSRAAETEFQKSQQQFSDLVYCNYNVYDFDWSSF